MSVCQTTYRSTATLLFDIVLLVGYSIGVLLVSILITFIVLNG